MKIESGRVSEPFEGCLTSLEIGPVALSRAYSTAAVIHRSGTPVTRFRPRNFILTMGDDNGFSAHTDQCQNTISARDMLITDSTQAALVSHEGCTALTVRVPENSLRRYIPDTENLSGVILRGDRGSGAVAATMIRSLLPARPQAFDGSSGSHLSAALLHAIAAACAEALELPVAAFRPAVQYNDVIRYVEAHLSDAELTVTQVAEQFAVSARYIRMLFSKRNETLSEYIRRRRLDEAAEQLKAPEFCSQTVSEIAIRWGFNSLGSFDRAFRARFAVTPRQYRERSAKQ